MKLEKYEMLPWATKKNVEIETISENGEIETVLKNGEIKHSMYNFFSAFFIAELIGGWCNFYIEINVFTKLF